MMAPMPPKRPRVKERVIALGSLDSQAISNPLGRLGQPWEAIRCEALSGCEPPDRAHSLPDGSGRQAKTLPSCSISFASLDQQVDTVGSQPTGKVPPRIRSISEHMIFTT
jgi:hypothetical protein